MRPKLPWLPQTRENFDAIRVLLELRRGRGSKRGIREQESELSGHTNAWSGKYEYQLFEYKYHIIQEYEKEHDFGGREIVEALQRKLQTEKETSVGGIAKPAPTEDIEDIEDGAASRSPRVVGAMVMQ